MAKYLKIYKLETSSKEKTMEEERSKRYYSISEVSEMMELKAHILRFWESEFSALRPRKNRAGNRAYTERDIKIVRLIKNLLYEEKFTIEGAKNRLKHNRELIDEQLALPLVDDIKPEIKKTEIDEIKNELLGIIEMVKEL